MTPVQAVKSVEVSTGVYGLSTAVVAFPSARFHVLMAALTVPFCILLAVLFRLENISAENVSVSVPAQCAMMIGLAAAYCHWCGHVKLRESCLLLLWSFLLVALLPLPQYAAARTGMPIHDALLARIDEAAGFNVGAIFNWTTARPALNIFLGACYAGLFPYVFIAMALPPIAGKFASARVFILSAFLGVIAVCAIMACFPATAPWTIYHYPLYDSQRRYMLEITALRASGRYAIDPQYSSGLIEFPSFHVALAVMATRALWVFRWLRLPGVIMAALVAVSTMTTGMHYATDVAVGALLAVAVNALSERLLAYE